MSKRRLTRRQLIVATGVAVPATVLAAAGAKRDERPSSKSTSNFLETRNDDGNSAMSDRDVARVVQGQPTTDGAGVKLHRALGSQALAMLDPFLMLDEFFTDRPEDYIKGFPDHPHRGFETVTYMIQGAMEHRDSLGNHGRLEPGSVQWMTAGRGIIHSEMPKQENGLMWGFQLWSTCRPR
jgi:redox-sensitive bicupin YhaK (pirin superfamily)